MTEQTLADPVLNFIREYLVWMIITHPIIGLIINMTLLILIINDRFRFRTSRRLERVLVGFLKWTLMWPSYYFVWGVKPGTYWELKKPHTYWTAPEYEDCIVEVLRYSGPATVRVKFLHATWKGKPKHIDEEIAVDLSRTKGKRKLTETEATIWAL